MYYFLFQQYKSDLVFSLHVCSQLERVSESLSAFEAFATGCVEHLEESFPLPQSAWLSTLGLPTQSTWQWSGAAPLLSPATGLPPPHPQFDSYPFSPPKVNLLQFEIRLLCSFFYDLPRRTSKVQLTPYVTCLLLVTQVIPEGSAAAVSAPTAAAAAAAVAAAPTAQAERERAGACGARGWRRGRRAGPGLQPHHVEQRRRSRLERRLRPRRRP